MEQPYSSSPIDPAIDEIYTDGAIQPLAPLSLPDGTPLQLRLALPITAHISLAPPAESTSQADTPLHVHEAASVVPPMLDQPLAVPRAEQDLRYLPPLRLIMVLLALACAYAAHASASNQALIPTSSLALALVAWLGGITLAAVACYPRVAAEAPATTPLLAWTRFEIIGVVALFVGALLVRLAYNGSIPAALTGDEASMGLTATDIVAGRFNNPFVTGWFAFPSLFFNLPAAGIWLFGQNYTALRTPAALAGALTVVGLYWFGRVFFSRVVALASAALLAALHVHLHFSRLGLNNIWDGLFGVLTLGAFWRAWQTGRRAYFIATGVLIGLSQYFYASARVVPLVLVAWLGVMLVANRRLFAQRLPGVLCIVLLAVVTYVPLGLFFVDHPEDFSAPVSRVSLLQRPSPNEPNWFEQTSQHTGTPLWRVVVDQYQTAALGFVSVPLRSWYDADRPLLLVGPATMFVFGLLLLVANIRDPRSWLLLLMLFGMVSISALTESTPAAQRYVIAAPIATLVAGVAFGAVLGQLTQRWPRYRRAFGACAVLLVAVAMASDLHFYFDVYAPEKGQGDGNTRVASQLGMQLSTYQAGTQLFFFGPPRMGYRSVATVPFLAPQVAGNDVNEPLTSAPTWPLHSGSTVFVFLPERQNEAPLVAQQYPGGSAKWVYDTDNKPLYYMYEVKR